MKNNPVSIFQGLFLLLIVALIWIFPDAHYHLLAFTKADWIARFNAYGVGKYIITVIFGLWGSTSIIIGFKSGKK